MLVTVTGTVPAGRAGVTAVIVVPLTNVTPAAGVPPKFRPTLARKPVPVIVTAVPPAVGPDEGVIELGIGAGS